MTRCLVGLIALCLVGLAEAPLALGASKEFVVGTGTPASCTEAALTGALLTAQARGGGKVRFNCGPAPVTISVLGTLILPDDTTIDGDKRVTLFGNGMTGLFVVDEGVSAELRGLTITHANSYGVSNAGTLKIRDCVFNDNDGLCGSAIRNLGTVTIRDSQFTDGFAFFSGGAICNLGRATIHDSTFTENAGGGAANGGGAIWSIGELTVTNSVFAHNTAFIDPGGAIFNGGTLTVKNSVFFQNEGGAGGAIFNDGTGLFDAPGGTLTIRNSVIVENSVDGAVPFLGSHGGGIYNFGGTLDANNIVVSDNTAALSGGGIFTCCGGSTTLKNAVVTGNTPDDVVP
jgi:predicted outer membrane repeat protein